MKPIKAYLSIPLLLPVCAIILLVPFVVRGGVGAHLLSDTEPVEELLPPILLPQPTIPFKDSLCRVADPHHALETFYSQLDALRAGKDTVISIVHLGDSHIQAGHLSGTTMRLLHQQFGNAGRGWIAPLKLSKTNEPDDYAITSIAKDWIAGRCIQSVRKSDIGVGGMAVLSASPSINFDVAIAPNNGAGYGFNQAILYRGDRAMPLLPAGNSKQLVHYVAGSAPLLPGVVADTFRIAASLLDTLQLQSSRRKPGTDSLLPPSAFQNLYFGLSLTNGKPGILYHSIGINGAMFVNYTDEAYVKQLTLLRPALLIVSLGTNETFGRRFTSAEFAAQVASFVRLLKRELPTTALLLTTPPECYKRVRVNKKRTFVRNEQTQLAAKQIQAICDKEGIACWDLFGTTGGKNSSRKWMDAKMLAGDRVHFTKEGYREQGALLFRGLMDSYNRRNKPTNDYRIQDN